MDVPIVFRQGDTVMGSTYSGAADAVIDRRGPDTAEGGLDYCAARGGSKALSCLMKWDLAALPTTTVVTRACVQLYIDDPSTGSFDAYELLHSWNENTATWNKSNIVIPWEVPGAQGSSDRGTTSVATIPSTSPSPFPIAVPISAALVQRWVSTPTANRGVVFAGTSADGVSFEAKESPTLQFRPALLVFDGPGGL